MAYLPLGDPFLRQIFTQIMEKEVRKLVKINRNWQGAFEYLQNTYLNIDAIYRPQGQI